MGILTTLGVLVLAGGVGGFMALAGAGYLQTYARLKRSDPVDVRRLDDPGGSVELAGTARSHEETSRSPFTDTECLLHEWKVRERSASTQGSNWNRLDSGNAAHAFVLEDDTGAVLVDPAGASLQLETTATFEVDPGETPPPGVEAYLERTDAVDREHDRRRRYLEMCLESGDDVHVLGPIREAGHSFDLPGSVDAVVGVENPDERGITIGEDDLSTVLEKVGSGSDRFLVTNADESGAEQAMLKKGVLWLGMGVLVAVVPVVLVVFG